MMKNTYILEESISDILLSTDSSHPIVSNLYSWEGFPIDSVQRSTLINLQPSLQVVTYESFQSNEVSFSLDKLESTILQSNNYFLLRNNETKKIIGFAFIYTPRETLFDRRFCYINKIAISSSFQGRGFASRFRNILLETGYAWLCARTQNPAIMYNFSANSLITFPFKDLYSSTENGRIVMEFIQQYVPQVRESIELGESKLNTQTGIFKGLYGHPLGNNYENKSTNFIDETSLLSSWDFNPMIGDALLVTSYFNFNQ